MFGMKTLTASSGIPIQATYDGHPEWLAGSVTLDWTTVAAVSGSPVVLNDQLTIPVGQKFLRYGQVLAEITATGLWGPFDPAANDGRQLFVNGSIGILNQTILQNGVLGVTAVDTDDINVIVGGRVWLARILQSGVGTHSLAAGPTLAELLAALPRLMMAY